MSTLSTPTPAPFAHWMLREIFEQPETLGATVERYVSGNRLRSDRCTPMIEWLEGVRSKIVIAASGSSRHAGLVAELLIEDLSSIPVDVEYASEYCYRREQTLANNAVLVISQSGETADTLAALRKANGLGNQTMAITNVHGSSMAQEATVSFPTVAGRERAVPATKSFSAQLLNLYLLALMSGVARKTMDATELGLRLAEIEALPRLVAMQLRGWEESMRRMAERYASAGNFLFLGRGIHYPIAREGALKLKESAYLHAEGYPSGELKHGPNALVSPATPLVMMATVDRSAPDSVERYEKVVQLMRDMRQQGANILAVANCGDQTVAELADHVVAIEPVREPLLAICETIPLQLFSYWMATNNGIDVDHPRNLTKAVLAE
ncbi:MAG: SIS domain-containing protein [Acidobacteriaceae bacterium]